MRIILTHAGKEEISKNDNNYNNQNEPSNNILVLNTDSNTRNDINSKRLVLFPSKAKSLNKYKNNVMFTESNKYNNRYSNSLLKAGLYSIKNINNYKQNNYKNPFSNYLKKNNTKSDLPLKLISLNSSVVSLPDEAKQLYDKEEKMDKSQLIKLNISNNNIKNNNEISNSFDNSRNISLPKINMSNGLSLKNLLSSKNKRNIDDYLLKKEINKSDTNLINNEKLFKLDKICQKYFHNEEEGIILKNNIQLKIRKGFSKDSEFCKKRLNNMNNSLKGIENIYKGFQMKMDKIRDNKINYLK